MAVIRQSVRNTIDTGTAIFATVESYHLGLATVRLASNGARLSNLVVIGGTVVEGDIVIVDYSAGTKPVVRPAGNNSIETQVPASQVAIPLVSSDETYGVAEDIGCRAISFPWDSSRSWMLTGVPYQPLMRGVWTKLNWTKGDWDPAEMIGIGSIVTIPVTGFYLINTHWDECVNALEILGILPPNIPVWYKTWEFSGYYASRVKCNGTIILFSQSRDTETARGRCGHGGTMFDHFEEGDKLEMEVFSSLRVDNTIDMAFPTEGFSYGSYASSWWRRTLTVHCVLTG